ncbi:GDP-mannose 4,6 dehydratase 1 [Coccidioides immitis RMSCC 2394]|uniref:GDP-mannose 4,6-dehydratase n=1 Tax=Coccidioides immitis RMSCC 2394 TaxID=404692 RepID=A0A0J6YQI3_COCIT|nr:GDP-mannose 4,6 dehydratase 1 [Coccidioides immitis RMSCC 2394]
MRALKLESTTRFYNFQFWATVNFREAYGFHASNGILFNHESPRRDCFELGNLNAVRDWGHAKDYMRGVHLMLQQPTGGDYVLASGQAYSVREFVEAAFQVIGVKIDGADLENGPTACVIMEMVKDGEGGQGEVVLWICAGVGDNHAGKRGYYLQDAKSVSADINSTDLRRALVKSHSLDETKLNQLSTGDLLELLAPILRKT